MNVDVTKAASRELKTRLAAAAVLDALEAEIETIEGEIARLSAKRRKLDLLHHQICYDGKSLDGARLSAFVRTLALREPASLAAPSITAAASRKNRET